MKTFDTGADMQALENRYGAGFAQYLADQMAAIPYRPIDFLDVKERNDAVAGYRARIRDLVACCRIVRADSDTALLRRQIAQLRHEYRSALLDSRALMDEYLRRLKTDGIAQMQITTQNAKAA